MYHYEIATFNIVSTDDPSYPHKPTTPDEGPLIEGAGSLTNPSSQSP